MKKAKTFGGLDGQTAKFLAVINENTPRNLTTREMQYWINRPMELKKILENLRVPDNTAPRFTCWKKISVGNFQDAIYLYAKLGETTVMKISSEFDRLESKMTRRNIGALSIAHSSEQFQSRMIKEKTDLELTVVTPAELGLKGVKGLEEIYGRAKELGLKICSPDVAFQLCIQHENSLLEYLGRGDVIYVASEPVIYRPTTIYSEVKYLFYITRDIIRGFLVLDADSVGADHNAQSFYFGADTPFVFVLKAAYK